MEILNRKKIISIGLTVVLLIGLVVGVVLVQKQQILKSKASQEIYNAFAVRSGDSEHYVRCTGNVCETNTLSITMSVRDLTALEVKEEVASAAKTPEQCRQELGTPGPICDLGSCIKNEAVVKDNECSFEPKTVDLSLCPNNCQAAGGAQSILCREFEICQKDKSSQLTGNLIKYWVNDLGGTDGCQAQEQSVDTDKCPTGQALPPGQYTSAGGGLTGQTSTGLLAPAFCSAQDYSTACWQGSQCKEENQGNADKACSNNHGQGSKCTRSTGQPDVFEDGCTTPPAISSTDINKCSAQYYATACWQGADCKEENQSSADSVCSQNHGIGSVCMRSTGQSNAHEDGCTFGTNDQAGASAKANCTSEAYATTCWQGARCDETNQQNADYTCSNNHGPGSKCTRSTGQAGTSNDGCTVTVLDIAKARQALKSAAAPAPDCEDKYYCSDDIVAELIIADSCGKKASRSVVDPKSCAPELDYNQAFDLHFESKRLAELKQKQEEQKQEKPFWEKAGDVAGGLWNGIISLGKGIQEAPTLGEVNQANAAAFSKNIESFLGENQRKAEQVNASPECQNALTLVQAGVSVEAELLKSCFGSVGTQKSIEKKAEEAEACALESGDIKTCLRKTGVNMDVGEAKIAKTGFCLNMTYDPNARCVGFTGESVVPADASQNLSEVLRKAEVVKLAESLGLDLEKDDPKNWEAAKRKFFFNAVARTDINASKYMAEFLGIPITAWENADKAAKICARDHKYACFVNSSVPPVSWIQSVSSEQIDQLNQVSQNYFRGFEPASPELLRKYGYLVDVNVLNQTGKQFGKPLEISAEDWDKVLRTFRVYAQTGDNIKNNTAAGRLYQEKQTQAVVESYIGLVSTVVDPFPAAQALVSGLKYVVVKQVYKRLSERFGSKVASEMAEHITEAAASGRITSAAGEAAVKAAAEAAGLPPTPNAADQIRIMVDSGVVEPPPAVQAIADARVSPEVEQTALQALKDSHSVSAADLDGQRVVIPDREAGFVAPEPTNPIRAVQDGVNGLVDDVESLLNRGPPAPAVEVAERAAGSFDNPVLDGVAREGEEVGGKLAQVADHLDETASRVGVEPSAREPNPAEGILVDGRDRAAGVINEVRETADAVGKEVDRFVHGSAIEDARSIDELYEVVKARGNLKGTYDTFTPEQSISIIERVRSGDLSLDNVTRAGGLRDKVRELVEAETREVQKTVQAQINSRNYDVKLNVVDPPKPVRKNPIDPEKAKQWVASHDTPEARRAAQAIVDNTRHISQEEFEIGLHRAVKSLNESLPADEKFMVMTGSGGSNKWVSELALPKMDKLPSNVVDVDNLDEVSFTAVRRFVFFDDAIYSGSQMRGNLIKLLSRLSNNGVDMSGITIHVVAPYATNYGKYGTDGILSLLSGTAFRDAKIIFGAHEFLPSVAEAIGDPQIISSIQKMYKHGAESRTLTYFDHKIPDFISTLAEALNNGEIRDLNGVQKGLLRFIPETHSPYHGVSSQQAALSELEQKMKVSGQGKYLVSSIPEVGPQIEKQVYFVKTGEGDLVALKYGNGSQIPAGRIRRGDEIIPLNDKPSVKLKKGDEVILGSATLSPTTSGSVEYHLFYDGEKLVKDIPLPETAGKYPAPCPIFSLIPVALAKEGGGLNPCPKNPLAALARNAGNAFKQAGDGIGGIFDRFRASKPESRLDRIVPTTASEKAILNKAKIVEAVTDKDISLLNKAGAEVAQQAKKYDYVIVSGQSADISETILIKQGVSKDKIIKFSVDDNAHVYKIVDGQATQFTEEERNALTREALASKGVNLAGERKPTFLIVDDISDTGYKATAYLDRFSQIEGVGETQYAALSALRGAVIDPSVAGTGNFANFSKARLEELAQKTFAPSKLSSAEKSRVAYVMNNLSGVLEGNTLKNDTISYNVLVSSRITAKKVLERVSEQKPNPIRVVLDNALSTVQNTGRRIGDTVGGWVDNFRGIFQKGGKEEAEIETFTKYPYKSNVPIRFGESFPPGGEEEFKALSRLYNADPEHVVKPIGLVRDGNGVIGYKMEYVRGQKLNEYIEANGSLPVEILEQINTAVEKFHKAGLAHGDLNRKNIIITPEGKIKIIDPVAYPQIKPEYIQNDLETLSGWLSRTPIGPCPIRIGLVGVVLAQEGGGLTPCPKNPLAALWHNAQNTGRQVLDKVTGLIGDQEEKRALQAIERGVREIEGWNPDRDFLKQDIAFYRKDYQNAVKKAAVQFPADQLPQAKQDLLSILTSGELRGEKILAPWEVPGHSGYSNVLPDRHTLIALYLQDPELAMEMVRAKIVGGHGSGSGSLLGVLENGLKSQNEIIASGGVVITGEKVGIANSAELGEDFVSFSRWSETKTMQNYANFRQGELTAERLSKQIKDLQDLIMEEKDPHFEFYQPDEKLRAERITSLERIIANLEQVVEFLNSPHVTQAEALRARLLQENFPIVYLVDNKVNPRAGHPKDFGFGGGVTGEFVVKGSVDPGEIKIILVPSNKIAEVETLVKSHGRDWQVKAIENLEKSTEPIIAPASKNIFQKTGDTVGGWVDNFRGIFQKEGKEEGIIKIEGQSNIAEVKQLFDEIKSAGNTPGNFSGVMHRKVSFEQDGAEVANFTRFKARVGDNLLLGTTHTNTPAERALIDQFFEEVVKRDIDTVYFEQAPLNAGVDLTLWLSSNGYISQKTAQLLGSNVDGSELIYLFEKLTKRGIKVVNMDLSYNPSVSALAFAIEHYGIERTVRDLNQHLFLVSQATLFSSSVDHLPVDVLRSEKIPEIITRLINEAGGNIDSARVKSLIEGRDFILEDLFTDAEREAYMLTIIAGKNYAIAAHSAHTSALAEKLFGTQKLQDLQLYVDGDKVSRTVSGSLRTTQELITQESVEVGAPKNFLEQAGDTVRSGWNGTVDFLTEVATDKVGKKQKGFDVNQVLSAREGPLVELAGPTDTGYEATRVYKKDKKYYVSEPDGTHRSSDKELIVSNIDAEGCPLYEDRKGNVTVRQGQISFRADATRVPLKNGSIGALFVSCLPITPERPVNGKTLEGEIRRPALEQAYNALEDGGILIWQGGWEDDIIYAHDLGFQIVQYTKTYVRFSNKEVGQTYNIVFQKNKAGGLDFNEVTSNTPKRKVIDWFNGIFNAGKKQGLSWEVLWA